MLKLIVRAALPFLAATAIAQAADRSGSAMVTYIDKDQGRVLLNNSQYHTPASIDGIRIGDMMAMPGKIMMGAAQFSTIEKSAPMSADGRITWIGGHQMLVANQMMQMPSSFDMSAMQIGMRARVDYMMIGGTHTAIRIGWDGKPSMSLAMSAAPVNGRITFVDRDARTVLVNNSWMTVPMGIDIHHVRIGDSIVSITEASKAHEIPARG